MDEKLNIAGCDVFVRRGGAGAPLLFLHGAGGVSEMPPALHALEQHFSVIVPDHPGFGQSEDPAWLTQVADLVYCYLELFEHLDLRNVHVVGHSLGGWIALELAIRDASRIASLTLVASAGISLNDVPKGDVFMWSPQETPARLYGDPKSIPAPTSPPSADALLRSMKNRETTARLAWSPRFENPNLAKWLRRIRVPTKIIWGDRDQLFPPAYAEAFHSYIPQADISLFEGCGHLPHIEQPERFVAEILKFTQGRP